MRVQRAVVAVLASRVGVEEKWILGALRRRGLPFEQVDTRKLWRSVAPGRPPWRLALNREIGYTRALHATRTLEAQGVHMVNSAWATEVCGDKWRTTLALAEAGLPVPRTALALTPDAALDALDELGYPAVVKPVVGSWGRLVTRVPDRAVAETVMEYLCALPSPQSHLVYVQELVAKPGRDIRALVIDGAVVGAAYRRGSRWRTNVSLGGEATYCTLPPEVSKIAIAAAGAVGADIAGVDLIEDLNDEVYVLEVNHRVEFRGLQRAMGDRADIAGRVADHLADHVAGARG